MESLQGRFSEFLYQSGDAWGVGVLEDDQGDRHKIVGHILASPGDEIRVEGEFIEHPRFGRQFKIRHFHLGQARGQAGVMRYLERLPNVGPVRAACLYREFGEQIFEVLENDPQSLCRTPGITGRMVEDIRAAYLAEKNQRDLIVFLKQFDLTDGKIAKILAAYGPDLTRVLKEEPYRMIADIDGFGFKTVDQIAQASGVAKDSPARIAAGLLWTLQGAQDEGHTYLPRDVVLSLACKALRVPAAKIVDALKNLEKSKTLVVEAGGVFLPHLFKAETAAAHGLAALVQNAEARP
ncbi:MAG: hypothetical protein C4575_09520 [Desulforudis sp.]|jgi:exodeoxyribonuclease V alpha subunit|nr:MAG: hypothetical protein C4575_09520 [Desulforudis sp.]